MTNFNFEYKGTFLRYKDSNGNLLDLNGSQIDTDLDERTEQNETDIAALQQYFDSISVKEDASGGVASFADGAKDIPVKSLVVNIELIQEGTGDPSPENVRPISGRTEVNIWRDAEHDTTADPTITIQLGQTVYGGTLNVTTGVLTVDMAMVDLGSLSWISENNVLSGLARASGGVLGAVYFQTPVCSFFKGTTPRGYSLVEMDTVCFSNTQDAPFLRVRSQVLSGLSDTEIKTALTGAQLCYELAAPTTFTLTPQQMTTLLGTNNIWADSGNVAVKYVADTKLYIDSAIAASADSAESVNANNREEVKETINEIEKPDVIEEKEVINDNIEEEKEI